MNENNLMAIRYFLEEYDFFKDHREGVDFKATIEYTESHLKKEASVLINKGNSNYGQIDLISNEFDSDDVHKGFSPKYQTYKFDNKTKSLIIKGTSYKDRQPYTVIITPLLN